MMSDPLTSIRKAVSEGRYVVSDHAADRCYENDLLVGDLIDGWSKPTSSVRNRRPSLARRSRFV